MKLYFESSYCFIEREVDLEYTAITGGDNKTEPRWSEISPVKVTYNGKVINDALDRLNSIIGCRITRMRNEGKLVSSFNIWDSIFDHIREEIS